MAPSAGRKVLVASSLPLSASEASWTSIDSALMGGVALEETARQRLTADGCLRAAIRTRCALQSVDRAVGRQAQ
jgi:hypothetical protein